MGSDAGTAEPDATAAETVTDCISTPGWINADGESCHDYNVLNCQDKRRCPPQPTESLTITSTPALLSSPSPSEPPLTVWVAANTAVSPTLN